MRGIHRELETRGAAAGTVVAVRVPLPSLPAAGDGPPAITTPELGQRVPLGEPCPQCGQWLEYWVYNPFVRRSQSGWVRYQAPCCSCSDPYAHGDPQGVSPGSALRTTDQQWLDTQFGQRSVTAQTLVSFDLRPQPRLRAMWEAVNGYAQRYQSGRVQGKGVFLAGPAGIGKSHLVNGLVNGARSLGTPALSLSLSRLLDRVLPPGGSEAGTERDERLLRRKAVRAVPVLALRGFLMAPLLPSELKELDLLLEYREERGYVTHFTAAEPPAKLRARVSRTHAPIVALVRRVERLTELALVAPPGVEAYTEAMRAAAQRRAGTGGAGR